jgi:hypothetical protein
MIGHKAVRHYRRSPLGRILLQKRKISARSGRERPAARLTDRPKLLAEMRRLIRVKHFAYSTETAYLDWADRFFSYLAGPAKSVETTMIYTHVLRDMQNVPMSPLDALLNETS